MQQNSQISRRQFLRGAIQRKTLEIKSSKPKFFQQRIGNLPQIEPNHWSFTLGGMVQTPLYLTYDDLLNYPSSEIECVIACIGNKAGGLLAGSALWQGVPLSTLFDQAQILPQARYARFFAADGYVTSVEIDQLQPAMLVYAMNGKSLPPEHGFPSRLIIPGLYGYKMPKWIQRISLSDLPHYGLWEERGWSTSGKVQTHSVILSPRPLETVTGVVHLSGIAYAGLNTIKSIAVSIEGGDWMAVDFNQGPGYGWTHWKIDWTPPTPGDYQIAVRATDDNGYTQLDNLNTSPYPDGSNAIHKIVIRIRE